MSQVTERQNTSIVLAGGALVFPSDIVPEDPAELDKWMKKWSDAIYNYGAFCLEQRDIRNYQYAQGILIEENFSHVTDLFKNNKNPNQVVPAKLRSVNSIARILNDILGVADGDDFKWNVAVSNESAVTEKLENLVEKQTEDVARFVRQQSGMDKLLGSPVEEGDDVLQVDPKDIERRNLLTFQQKNEKWFSKGLKYLMESKKHYLKYKFIHQGLYNYAITRKMAFDTSIKYGDPYCEPIDSRLLVYELESNSPFIHKGRFAGYYFSTTPQEAIDRCPNLTKAQVKYISDLMRNFTGGKLPAGGSMFWFKHQTFRNLYLNGMRQNWKGLKKKLVKVTPNKYDEANPHIHFVSEEEHADWKAQAEKLEKEGKTDETGVHFEYKYYDVKFECTRIGESVYYQMRECPNQLIDEDEPSEQELDIIGVHDDIPCIVDLLVPLEEMSIECYYTLESLLNQPIGKIMVIDEALEEDGQENLYNMRVWKVYKINSQKEGEQAVPGTTPLQPKEIDLGMSEAVTQIMRLIDFLEMSKINITTGNAPFQGGVKSEQGLGVTQLAQQSAQRPLQPYFSTFYTVTEMVLQRMCDLMGPAWGDKDTIRYWAGDDGADFFKLIADTGWAADRCGVYVHNKIASAAERKAMIDMASQVLPIAKDPELALSIIKMMRADSAAEAEEIFKQGVAAINKIKNKEFAIQQQQLDVQKQQIEAGAQAKLGAEDKKGQVVIQKTQMEQQGETQRTQMKVQNDQDKHEVKGRDEIQQMIVQAILEYDTKKNIQPENA